MFTLIALYLEYRQNRATRIAAVTTGIAAQVQPANDAHASQDLAKAA